MEGLLQNAEKGIVLGIEYCRAAGKSSATAGWSRMAKTVQKILSENQY